MIVVICAANVFGKPKTNTDFIPYNGDGFKISIPSKWNPSKEVEYPGQVLRYEDNSDSTTNLTVTVTPTDKKSIKDYGSPEEFLSKVNSLTKLLGFYFLFFWLNHLKMAIFQVDYLLGKTAFFGNTEAEVTLKKTLLISDFLTSWWGDEH